MFSIVSKLTIFCPKTLLLNNAIKTKERKLNNDLYKWVSLKKINKYPTTLICRNILKNYNLI